MSKKVNRYAAQGGETEPIPFGDSMFYVQQSADSSGKKGASKSGDANAASRGCSVLRDKAPSRAERQKPAITWFNEDDLPCAPDLWQRLRYDEHAALRKYRNAMARLPESLRKVPKKKIISVYSDHFYGVCKISCNLPRAKTRNDYMELATALIEATEDPRANNLQSRCLLASFIAYQREFNVHIIDNNYADINGFETVLWFIACGESSVEGEEAYLDGLFAEIETGYIRRRNSLYKSNLKKNGVPVCEHLRSDGATGFDETQSVAVSLYHEYLRFKKIVPSGSYLKMLKQSMSAYAPLVGVDTRVLLLSYRKEAKPEKKETVAGEVDAAVQKASNALLKIKKAMRYGVELDFLEALKLDAMVAAIKDGRIGAAKKEMLVSQIKEAADQMQEKLDLMQVAGGKLYER